VRNVERRQAVAVSLEHVARLDLDELELIRQLADHALQRAEQVDEPARAVDVERQLAAAQRERLEHPRQPEDVIRVEVRDEHLLQLEQTHGRAQQLPLGALGTVEQKLVAAAAHEQRRRPALSRRHRARRAEKDDVQVHDSILGWPSQGNPARRR
jgi:hypothetical protein